MSIVICASYLCVGQNEPRRILKQKKPPSTLLIIVIGVSDSYTRPNLLCNVLV